MATRVWLGGSGSWTAPDQWNGGVPQLDDTAIITAGFAALAGAYDAIGVTLGGAGTFATLVTTSATIGNRFTITSDAAHPLAGLATAGTTGFAGTIEATAPGGTFGITATTANGAEPADFLLRQGGLLEVSGGDAVFLNGRMDVNATVVVGAGSSFVDNGEVHLADAAMSIMQGGALGGSGSVTIGRFSSLFFGAGVAAGGVAIAFSDAGGRLRFDAGAGYSGTVQNFLPGDVIDLVSVPFDAGVAAGFAGGVLTVTQAGSPVLSLSMQGPADGPMQLESDGAGGTYVEDPGSLARFRYTIAGADIAMGADVVRATMHAPGGAAITGAGVRVGIISTSFNALGGADADAAGGFLPATVGGTSAVTVLGDDPGGDDEGRAMAEIIHQTAPGAQLLFSAGGASSVSFAAAVSALVAAGCDIIVDDLGFPGQPAYQVAGTLDAAVQNAVAAGVSYFTAAGNDGTGYFEGAFTPALSFLPAVGFVQAQQFGNGTPYQQITIPGGSDVRIELHWDAPWPARFTSAQDSLTMQVTTPDGTLVATSTPEFSSDINGNVPVVSLTLHPAATTAYDVAIYYNDGTPAVTRFGYVLEGIGGGGSSPGGTVDDPAAAGGVGSLSGQALVPGVNTIGAVTFPDSPAFGMPLGFPEYFSEQGPGTLLFDGAGNRLAVPLSAGKLNLLAPDGEATAVPGFAPFNGTSAAAPAAAAVAALMLQANPGFSPAAVSGALASSALDDRLPAAQQGAGLIQAVGAVELAAAACFAQGTRILTARGFLPVERMRAGMRVPARSGRLAPVMWVGRRTLVCERHADGRDVWPVRVRAGAFGAGTPLRDVLLSPDHAVFVDGVLIPVRHLIDGLRVSQVPIDVITYWHIELPDHDVVLADGLPCESYLDTGNRGAFDGEAAMASQPALSWRCWDQVACAALVLGGPVLDGVKARLAS